MSRCNGHTIAFFRDYCCVYGFLTAIGKESNNFMSAKLNIEYLFPLFSLDCHDCSEFSCCLDCQEKELSFVEPSLLDRRG